MCFSNPLYPVPNATAPVRQPSQSLGSLWVLMSLPLPCPFKPRNGKDSYSPWVFYHPSLVSLPLSRLLKIVCSLNIKCSLISHLNVSHWNLTNTPPLSLQNGFCLKLYYSWYHQYHICFCWVIYISCQYLSFNK